MKVHCFPKPVDVLKKNLLYQRTFQDSTCLCLKTTTCKNPSSTVCLFKFLNTWSLQARLSWRLSVSCRLLSLVVFVEVTSGHPRSSSVEAPVYRGCPAWTHRCSPESRMTLRQRANPSWCGCCCAWSRDVLRSVRSRITCVELCVNNWMYLMCTWEYLHTCSTGSAVQALSRHHSLSFVPFPPRFFFAAGFGCSFQLVILFEMFFTSHEETSLKFSCLLLAVSQSVLFTLM